MQEAAKGQIVVIKSPKGADIEAIVDKVEKDRLRLNYIRAMENAVKTLKEGDEILVALHTSAGVKRMRSMVISNDKEFVIENAPTISDAQNREYVRAGVKIRMFIHHKQKLLGVTTLDLSGGGVKFHLDENNDTLCIGDVFDIRFQEDDLQKKIATKAKVIKALDKNIYVATFLDISEYDRDAIVKFCIKALS